MSKKNTQTFIPPGELSCIWMEAGIVGYKLCDRKYDCDHCSFDLVMRQHKEQPNNRSLDLKKPPIREQTTESEIKADEYFEQQLAVLLQPFYHPQLPDDRLYYRNHMWVRKDISDYVRVGIDHLAIQMLGTVNGIVLPRTPSHAQRDAPIAWIIHQDGAVALRSPISGGIVYANSSMKDCPYLIMNYPYTEGWILLLSPEVHIESGNYLMNSEEAGSLYHAQAKVMNERFLLAYHRLRPGVGQTLHDGGIQIKSLPGIIGKKSYYEIVHDIFQIL